MDGQASEFDISGALEALHLQHHERHHPHGHDHDHTAFSVFSATDGSLPLYVGSSSGDDGMADLLLDTATCYGRPDSGGSIVSMRSASLALDKTLDGAAWQRQMASAAKAAESHGHRVPTTAVSPFVLTDIEEMDSEEDLA